MVPSLLRLTSCLLAACLLSACTGTPGGVTPVSGFEAGRYLGKWYEIARLDHSFERGLERVTAEYSRREDGGISVLNRGYNRATGTWEEVQGKAYFLRSPDIGSLKVSFFGPFYGGYHIIALDKQDYQWSMVTGPNRDYLWILAREPSLPEDVVARLTARARSLNYPVDELIFVRHGE